MNIVTCNRAQLLDACETLKTFGITGALRLQTTDYELEIVGNTKAGLNRPIFHFIPDGVVEPDTGDNSAVVVNLQKFINCIKGIGAEHITLAQHGPSTLTVQNETVTAEGTTAPIYPISWGDVGVIMNAEELNTLIKRVQFAAVSCAPDDRRKNCVYFSQNDDTLNVLTVTNFLASFYTFHTPGSDMTFCVHLPDLKKVAKLTEEKDKCFQFWRAYIPDRKEQLFVTVGDITLGLGNLEYLSKDTAQAAQDMLDGVTEDPNKYTQVEGINANLLKFATQDFIKATGGRTKHKDSPTVVRLSAYLETEPSDYPAYLDLQITEYGGASVSPSEVRALTDQIGASVAAHNGEHCINVNLQLLHDAAKAANNDFLKIAWTQKNKPIRIESEGSNHKMLLMPIV